MDSDAIAKNTEPVPKYRVQDKATLGKCTITITLKVFRSEQKFLPRREVVFHRNKPRAKTVESLASVVNLVYL